MTSWWWSERPRTEGGPHVEAKNQLILPRKWWDSGLTVAQTRVDDILGSSYFVPLFLWLLLSLISSPFSFSYFISLNLVVPSPYLNSSLLGWASTMLVKNVLMTIWRPMITRWAGHRGKMLWFFLKKLWKLTLTVAPNWLVQSAMSISLFKAFQEHIIITNLTDDLKVTTLRCRIAPRAPRIQKKQVLSLRSYQHYCTGPVKTLQWSVLGKD